MGVVYLKGVKDEINCYCKQCGITKTFYNVKGQNLWLRLHNKQVHPELSLKQLNNFNEIKSYHHKK